ncbi:MAG: HNH endonuclease signature motif containing protein [Prevotella sp.]|nr:HNH endonuclease signature motif containing protein [Prevotella sp.]
MEAIITYRPDAQKTPGLFDRILTNEVLLDICLRVTGQSRFRVVKDRSTYNRGRLVFLEYGGIVNYISLSEANIGGRNSSLQSVPTAINMFYADQRRNKRLCYYFIPHVGNAFTDYHLFIYRLLMTAGIDFLNIGDYYQQHVLPYRNVDDLIIDRRENQTSNSSNNSSYVSKTSDKIQIYAKTFGASKYESTLLAIAISHIADRPIDLFNICEQDLTKLPQASLNTIEGLGNISMHYTSLFLDKREYLQQSDRSELRSASYTFNLFNRLGAKKCALCGCEIPEIIQGAHIWGVAQISRTPGLDDDTKFNHAVSGHNGLWLCQNHHKLFDSNIILLDNDGFVRLKDNLVTDNVAFIRSTTFRTSVDARFLSAEFKDYLAKRNETLDLEHSHRLAV